MIAPIRNGEFVEQLARVALQTKTLKGQTHDGIKEKIMRKMLRGYAKGKQRDLIRIGTIPVPHSKDKPSPRERQDKRDLVRRGATIFKKEMIR